MTNHYVKHNLDGISFHLQEHMDFSWLQQMGRVFNVFDQQDSGNICFGIENEKKRMFVKFAGVMTTEFAGDPQDAINRLKSVVPLYYDLQHPTLIQIEDHFEVGEGYAVVFEWYDGLCLHPHWSYPPPAKYTDPNSPYYKYKQLPISGVFDLWILSSVFMYL